MNTKAIYSYFLSNAVAALVNAAVMGFAEFSKIETILLLLVNVFLISPFHILIQHVAFLPLTKSTHELNTACAFALLPWLVVAIPLFLFAQEFEYVRTEIILQLTTALTVFIVSQLVYQRSYLETKTEPQHEKI